MKQRWHLTVHLLFAIIVFAISLSAQTHDKSFWQAIAKNKYTVPDHESADELSHQLSALLASPDPELRDELAYSILTTWIYKKNSPITTPTLISLTDEWRANLKIGIGGSGNNSVLKRSFSALVLSAMAAREAQLPFMGAERYHQLVSDANTYLVSERDLRGYDPILHWIHATAHTADLLAALADSPLLTPQEAADMLDAIDQRLNTATEIYIQGEQDRLAAAVVAIIHRKDFDQSTFGPWLEKIKTADQNAFTPTTVESLTRYRNHDYFLEALIARLSLEPDSPHLTDDRQQVQALLRSRLE
jgi:hypothetical protein